MWCKRWWVLLAVLTVGVAGCGDSGQGADSQVTKDSRKDGPAVAVREFLEAVRTGNDEKATMMLTAKAREKTAEMHMEVAPPGSDTAQFEVGKVSYEGEHEAQVASTWCDLDGDAQSRTDEIVWLLRQDAEGWRISGVAATVFAGEPPVKLNFEEPEEMLKKQQQVAEELRRRSQEANSQAQKPENSQNSIRR